VTAEENLPRFLWRLLKTTFKMHVVAYLMGNANSKNEAWKSKQVTIDVIKNGVSQTVL
jgi:hypothetical protein